MEENSGSNHGELKIPPPVEIFMKTGIVHIQLMDAVDVIEAKKKANRLLWQKKDSDRYLVSASVSIYEGSEIEIYKYYSATVPYFPTGALNIGEEFIFEPVTTNQAAVISVCCLHISELKDANQDAAQSCIGRAIIPLSRLEENRPVVQWYQLMDVSSKDGLRAAVKVKALFVPDGGPTPRGRRATTSSAPTINHTLSAVVEEADSHSISFKDGVKYPYIVNTNHETESVESRFQTPVGKSSVDEERPDRSSLYIDALSTKDKNSSFVDPTTTRRKLIPINSPGEGLADMNASSTNLTNHSLPTGIIDYCLVLGPASPHTVRPSHNLSNNSVKRILTGGKVFMYGQSPTTIASTPQEPPTQSTGLFSAESSIHARYVTEDIALWDRLPIEDFHDFELPSKIEWFACPEGSVTVLSEERPKPFQFTFMLNAGMETNDINGLCFNFFMEVEPLSIHDAYLEEPSSSSQSEPEHWWDYETCHPSLSTNSTSFKKNKKKIWTAVTVCLLFRDSFIKQLSKCMEYTYDKYILPTIEQWEAARRSHLQSFVSQQPSPIGRNQLMLPTHADNQKIELLKKFPSCHLHIDRILSFLFIECPIPIPGLLSVTLQFDSTEQSKQCVQFSLGSVEKLPVCALSVDFVLQLFGPRLMIDIVCCVLSECRMLFHSTEISKLHTVCEVFRTLIYPLKWTHVYLPVVPIHLLNLIEAPVPYLLGTHTDWLQFIHLDYLTDVVLIDCDSGAMEFNSVSAVVKLPEKEDRWLSAGLSRLKMPKIMYHEEYKPKKVNESEEVDDIDNLDSDLKIQLLFYDVLFHLLRYISECLFYLNPSCPVFNRPLFLSEYTTEEYHEALVLLTATNSFHELTESLHTPGMKFFYDCIEYYAELERKIISSTEESVVNDMSPSNKKQENAKRTLTRNVSVASIIFDKIAFSSPSVDTSSKEEINVAPSSTNPTDKPPNRAQMLTKQMSGTLGSPRAQKANPRTINRTVSFMGGGGEEFSPLKPRNILSTNSNSVTTDESLALLYPAWIFNSESHSDVPCPAYFNVYETIKLRLKQYIKISNISSNLNSNTSFLSIRIPNSNFEHVSCSGNRLDALHDLKLPVDLTEEIQTHKNVLSAFSLDYYGPENSHMMRSNSNEDVDGFRRSMMLLTKNKSFTEESSSTPQISSFPFVTFDPLKVISTQQMAKEWNVENLAKYFHVNAYQLLDKFHKSGHSYMVNAKPSGHRQSMAMGRASQRSLAIAAKNNALQKIQNTVNVDDCLIQFLQQVMTVSHVDGRTIEETIKGRLHKALELATNRQGLITVLKTAKNDDKKGSKVRQAAVSNVYPLNQSAFEAFIALFYEFLSICSQQKDYLNAYGLLEVGGQYFRVLPVELQMSLDQDSENDLIEFLSEKTCMHPIYQTTALWKTILSDRIPVSNLVQLNLINPTSISSKPMKSALKPENKTFTMKDLKNEIQSLLYIMLGLGVNSARALEFIRAVASDYRMGIDEYYKLQRFTNSLWASSEPTQHTADSTNPTSTTNHSVEEAIVRKSSRELNSLPQRRNTSINDIMAKQGHVDKMLKPNRAQAASFYNNDESVYNITNSASFWGKMDDEKASSPAAAPIRQLSSRSISFRVPSTSTKPKTAVRVNSDRSLLGQSTGDLNLVRVDSVDEGETTEVFTLQDWDEQNINSMFGIDKASSEKKTDKQTEGSNKAIENKIEPGNQTPGSPAVESIKHDNEYEEHAVKDLLASTVASSISSLQHYMLVGGLDGNVHIVDTNQLTCLIKAKHSNIAGDRYQGVTKINTLESPVHSSDSMFYTGCSTGILKAWTLPQDSNKIVRNKQAVAVIKQHTAPITCLSSQVLFNHSSTSNSMNWLLASGDSKGDVFITKGDNVAQQSSSVSAALRAAYAVNTHIPFSNTVQSNNSLLGSVDPAITALCLVSNSANFHTNVLGIEGRRLSVARPATPAAVNAGSDSYWLCVGTAGGLVGVVDVNTTTPLFLVEGHSARVSKIMPIKVHEFISAGYDRSVKLWDIRVRNKATTTLKPYGERSLGPATKRCGAGPVTDIAVGGQDNTLVISTTADGVIKLWDLRYDVHAPCSEIRAHRHRISSVLWTDRMAFHTCSYDGTVRSWDSIHGSNIRFVPVFDQEGVEQMAMTQSSHGGEGGEMGGVGDGAGEIRGERTCVAALSWTGGVKFFSYKTPGLE